MKKTESFEYSNKEIAELVRKDLISRGMIKADQRMRIDAEYVHAEAIVTATAPAAKKARSKK